MKSKNAKPLTIQEAEHILNVKNLPCSVCDAAPMSDAHHINQGQHFTVGTLQKLPSRSDARLARRAQDVEDQETRRTGRIEHHARQTS